MKKFFQKNVNTIKCKYITIVYPELLNSIALMIQEHYDNANYDDTLFLVNTCNSYLDLQKPEYNQHRCIYYNLEHNNDFDNSQKDNALDQIYNYKITEIWSMEPNCELWDTDLGVKFMPVRYSTYIKNNVIKQANKFDLGFIGLPVNYNFAPRRIKLLEQIYLNPDVDLSLKILAGYNINELCDEFSNCKFVLDTHRNYRHSMQNQVRIFEHLCLGHTVLSEKSTYNMFPGLIYEFENVQQLNDLVHTVEPQDFSEKYKEMTYTDEAYESYCDNILNTNLYKKTNEYFFGGKEFWRFNLVNRLIGAFDYKSYLEIGVSIGECFKRVKCESKTSVDPEQFGYTTNQMTSDQYFDQLPEDTKFDIIFIDGLHIWEQCYRDINNALKHLSPNGTIICHDMNPLQEMYQSRVKNCYIWNGDVWKAFVKLRSERNDLFTCMIEDCDYGLGIISWGNQEPIKLNKPVENLLYYDFKKDKNYLMNTVKLIDYLESNKLY